RGRGPAWTDGDPRGQGPLASTTGRGLRHPNPTGRGAARHPAGAEQAQGPAAGLRRDGAGRGPVRPRGERVTAGLPRPLHRLRTGGHRRLLCDQQRHPCAAHAAPGGDQRHQRDHPGRRTAAGRQRGCPGAQPGPGGNGGGQHQRVRRLRRDRSDAAHVPPGGVGMTLNLVQAAYIIAAVLFVLSLAGLSKHETARRGNALGIIGMTIALVATIWLAAERASNPGLTLALIAAAMAVGASIGLWRARVVEMTGMPQLIAMLHSFVGLAAVLIGYNAYLSTALLTGSEATIHLVEVFLGVFIGAVTFTGSVVAALKLSARISSNPLMLPHRHLLNLLALLASTGLLVWFVLSHALLPLLLMTVIGLAF